MPNMKKTFNSPGPFSKILRSHSSVQNFSMDLKVAFEDLAKKLDLEAGKTDDSSVDDATVYFAELLERVERVIFSQSSESD